MALSGFRNILWNASILAADVSFYIFYIPGTMASWFPGSHHRNHGILVCVPSSIREETARGDDEMSEAVKRYAGMVNSK